MMFARTLAGTALAAVFAVGAASAHPLDGITAEEYQKINEICVPRAPSTTTRSIR